MNDREDGSPGRPPGRRRRADGGRGWWDPGDPPTMAGPPWASRSGPASRGPAGRGWAGPGRRWFLRRFAGLALALLVFVVFLAALGGFVFASVFGLLGPDRPGGDPIVAAARLAGVALLVLGIRMVVGRVRTIARPIDELVDATRRVTAGDYSVRVNRPGNG